MTARIAPLSPPYTSSVQRALEKWMPPGRGVNPLRLFRTLTRHEALAERMRGLGGFLLGRGSLPVRTRELLILRTCARCGAEYEWGVHVAGFSAAAGLDEGVVRATTAPPGDDGAWERAPDALVMRLVDELHDTGRVADATWSALSRAYDENALLEMLAVVGYYHLISFVVNGARIEQEPWAATFPR